MSEGEGTLTNRIRCSNVRVPQQFLLDLHVRPIRMQQSRIRVAECWAANEAGFSHNALYPRVVQSEDQFTRSPE